MKLTEYLREISDFLREQLPYSTADYPHSDHYDSQKKIFFHQSAIQPPDTLKTLTALWQMLSQPKKFAPNSLLPTAKTDWQRFFNRSEKAQFIWLGHSTLLARLADKTLLIDPIWADYASPIPIMMKRFQASPIALSELPKIDAILYSHDHYDHLDIHVVRHFLHTDTLFIVPLALGAKLQRWGIKPERIRELDWWQSLNLDRIQIHCTPARHYSSRGLFDKNKTLWASYVLQTEQEKIYFSGDNAFGNGEIYQQIGEHFGGFDIAFVENGQYDLAWFDNHMQPEQTAKAVSLLKTKAFVPIHWGAYPLAVHGWNEPIQQSVPLIRQQNIQVITPLLGQVFDQHSQTEDWWDKERS